MKHRDPIIDDLHKLRQRMGRTHDFDVDRIAATIRQHERESGAHLLTPSPQRRTRVATAHVRTPSRSRARAVGS